LLFFNDKYYANDAESLIRREARKCLINSTNGDMNEIVKYVEDTSEIITHEAIENHAHLKCLLNGTYNIKSGKFVEEFSRDNIILQQIPRNYNESLKWDEIDKLTTQIISDKIDRQMFYDTISLCLHPYNGVYQQWGGVGIQGSGKGQLEVLVSTTLGKKNCSHTPIHRLATDMTLQKECAYDMCVFDTEVSDQSVAHLDTIKKWVTQDPFTGRGIYGHKTTFRPSSRLMFTTNELFELPNNIDADAIYDRTYLAQLNNRYRHTDNEIKNVMKKTATDDELDGFITYLLKNATWIAKHERTHYLLKPKDTRDIWNIFGNRIKNFFKKYFEIGASKKTPKQEVHNKWLHHALETGFGANDKKKFFALFDEIVGTAPMNTRIGNDQVYAYAGFGLKSSEEINEGTQVKIEKISYKCNDCEITYNTTEPLLRLRAFHREFYPNHLIIVDIEN
jgi:phage/plasmid-associated DNA primase